MKFSYAALFLAAATTALAACDNAALAGNGAAKQFITGCCNTDADCQRGCCNFNTGACASPEVAKGQCGKGNPAPGPGLADPSAPATLGTMATPVSSPAATPVGAAGGNAQGGIPAGAGPKCTNAANQNPSNAFGTGKGSQFITGCCASDADCASTCCGKLNGLCQAVAVANENAAIGGCGGVFGGQ